MKFSVVVLFLSISIFAGNQRAFGQTVTRPSQPPYTCNSVPPPANIPACEAAYTTSMDAWRANEAVLNQLNSNSLGTDNRGNIEMPSAAPVNNCVVGSPSYSSCMTTYAAADTAYQKARGAVTGIKNNLANDPNLATMRQDFQVQVDKQNDENVRLQTPTDFTVTGSLQEVQIFTKDAAVYYLNSGVTLNKYGDESRWLGDATEASCAAGNYTTCEQTGAGYASSAAYQDIATTANLQMQTLTAKAAEVCLTQNKLSMVQNNCNPNSPASAVFIPGANVPSTIAWFDPYTGFCLPTAPALCSQIFNGTPGGNFSNNNNNVRTCPGGGTGCISQVFVTSTPLGTKYTFKNKIGKDYSFYSKDLKDEQSMIKAGLTPAQAKKLSSEMTATKMQTEKNAPILGGQIPVLKASALPEMEKTANQKQVLAKPTTKTLNQNSIQPSINRKPSMEGLSRSLNGDLIGVRGDDIFKMINRRYQHKDQQVLFFGPYL